MFDVRSGLAVEGKDINIFLWSVSHGYVRAMQNVLGNKQTRLTPTEVDFRRLYLYICISLFQVSEF